MGVSIKGFRSQPGAVHIFTGASVGGSSNPFSLTGSIQFSGNEYLEIPGNLDWSVGTGDFTIEWFQFFNVANQFPRVFTIGQYPNAAIAVSIEGGTLYFWMNGSYVLTAQLDDSVTNNQWAHIAITRLGDTVTIYLNGLNVSEGFGINADIQNTEDALLIGFEGGDPFTYFVGKIANFRWVKGTAVYTSDFTIPAPPLGVVTNTKLLLQGLTAGTYLDDISPAGHSINNHGTTFSTETP